MSLLSTEELRVQRLTPEELQRLPRLPASFLLDNLTSGFNVGAAFRLADAFRFHELLLCGTTPVPPRPRIKKTSMGMERWVPHRYFATAVAALEEARATGRHVVVVELTDSSVPLHHHRVRFPAVFVFGDEMLGVSPEALALADERVFIPMLGIGNSLSVVTAMAITGYVAATAFLPAEQLRNERTRAGVTVRELCAASGVAFATISKIERGGQLPRHSTMKKLEDALERIQAGKVSK